MDVREHRVGDIWYCDYWRKKYEVLAVKVDGYRTTIRWEDGKEVTHSTSINKRDRLVSRK